MAYTAPTPAELKLRYAAFADVADETVQYWLTDSERFVDTSWTEADYAPALMARAAHSMALQGLGAAGSEAVTLLAGVTRFRSASMDVSISEAAASARSGGGYSATPYGQEFAAIQRRNFSGPRVVAAGVLDCGAPGCCQ